MSWSVDSGKVSAEKVVEAIDALNMSKELAVLIGGDEAFEQIAAAKEAAKVLFQSGSLGNEGLYIVSLSGHANPGHVALYSSFEHVVVRIQRWVEPTND